MIRVEVHMHGNLRRFLPAGVASMRLELADGTQVGEVARQLQAQHEVWVASIGDTVVSLAAPLPDGALLDFYPHLEGG